MKYSELYTADDLFDMFANQADASSLVLQPTDELANQLRDLAPDMDDATEVAASIQRTANALNDTNAKPERPPLIKW